MQPFLPKPCVLHIITFSDKHFDDKLTIFITHDIYIYSLLLPNAEVTAKKNYCQLCYSEY